MVVTARWIVAERGATLLGHTKPAVCKSKRSSRREMAWGYNSSRQEHDKKYQVKAIVFIAVESLLTADALDVSKMSCP